MCTITRRARAAARRIVAAVTCLSCGAEYGKPHTSSCEFEQ